MEGKGNLGAFSSFSACVGQGWERPCPRAGMALPTSGAALGELQPLLTLGALRLELRRGTGWACTSHPFCHSPGTFWSPPLIPFPAALLAAILIQEFPECSPWFDGAELNSGALHVKILREKSCWGFYVCFVGAFKNSSLRDEAG